MQRLGWTVDTPRSQFLKQYGEIRHIGPYPVCEIHPFGDDAVVLKKLGIKSEVCDSVGLYAVVADRVFHLMINSTVANSIVGGAESIIFRSGEVNEKFGFRVDAFDAWVPEPIITTSVALRVLEKLDDGFARGLYRQDH